VLLHTEHSQARIEVVQRGKPRLRVALQELLAVFLIQRNRGRAFDDGTAKLSADSWKTAVLAGVELYDLVQSVVLASLASAMC
jgi:hypothetical protein